MKRRLVQFANSAIKRTHVLDVVNIVCRRKIANSSFKVPLIRGVGAGNLVQFEPWMPELLGPLTKLKAGAFIDIGANIGQTLLNLRSVAAEVSYVGLEPNPTCVSYLRELVQVNRFDNVEIVPVGIMDRTCVAKLQFYHEGATATGASVVGNFREGQAVRRVEWVPLFDFQSIIETLDVREVSVIKIDVEGAEWECLKSMGGVIAALQPMLLVEILPAYSAENSQRLGRQKKIEGWASKFNYVIFRIEKDARGSLSKLSLIHEIGVHSNLEDRDYLFVPMSLRERVESGLACPLV